MHISRELLWGYARGELPLRELNRLTQEHLLKCCPGCALEFQAFTREYLSIDHSQALTHFTANLPAELLRLNRAEKEAERWWRELARLSPETRKKRVVAAETKFRGPVFATLLLKETRRVKANDPRQALHCAELAELAIAFCLDRSKEIHALALAHQGNAYRALADFEQAKTYFQRARELCESVSDIATAAELDNLEGSLFLHLRDFPRAEQMFQRALHLARLLDDPCEIAANIIGLANSRYFAGDIPEAIVLAKQTIFHMAEADDEQLLLMAIHNLAIYLTAAEEYEEASQLLRENVTRYQHMAIEIPSWLNLFDWLASKIAAGLGEFEQAEARLLQVQAHFRQTNCSYDVALVGLDLAMLYVKRRRFADLCTQAAEVLALLRKYQLHGQAAQLLRVFELAVAERKVTAALVLQLRRELEHRQQTWVLHWSQTMEFTALLTGAEEGGLVA